MKHLSVLIALLSFFAATAPLAAQGVEGATEDPVLQFDELPPLDAVLRHMVAHSPRVKQQDALVEKGRAELNRSRLEWLDGFFGGVSSTYGSYGNATLDEISMGVQGTVSVRLSLFDLLGSRTRRAAFREELEVARQKREEVRTEEQRWVIDLYYRLDLMGRLVAVQAEARQAAGVHQQMAETEFSQAAIPVSELARVSEIAAKAHADYESARSAYLSLFAQLENALGVRLAELLPARS